MHILTSQLRHLESIITRDRILWSAFVAYISMTIIFLIIMWLWNFQIIDELFYADVIMQHVENLTSEQRTVHIIMTATLDVVYPFAYGIFQAGMAYRFFDRWGRKIALLSLMCIPVDLIEGFAQVMILDGASEYILLKTIVTPIKLMLFIPGLIFAMLACGILIFRKFGYREVQ